MKQLISLESALKADCPRRAFYLSLIRSVRIDVDRESCNRFMGLLGPCLKSMPDLLDISVANMFPAGRAKNGIIHVTYESLSPFLNEAKGIPIRKFALGYWMPEEMYRNDLPACVESWHQLEELSIAAGRDTDWLSQTLRKAPESLQSLRILPAPTLAPFMDFVNPQGDSSIGMPDVVSRLATLKSFVCFSDVFRPSGQLSFLLAGLKDLQHLAIDALYTTSRPFENVTSPALRSFLIIGLDLETDLAWLGNFLARHQDLEKLEVEWSNDDEDMGTSFTSKSQTKLTEQLAKAGPSLFHLVYDVPNLIGLAEALPRLQTLECKTGANPQEVFFAPIAKMKELKRLKITGWWSMEFEKSGDGLRRIVDDLPNLKSVIVKLGNSEIPVVVK